MTSTSLVAARLLFGGIQKGYAWTTRSVSPVRVRRTATRSVARGTGRILVRDAAVSAGVRVGRRLPEAHRLDRCLPEAEDGRPLASSRGTAGETVAGCGGSLAGLF